MTPEDLKGQRDMLVLKIDAMKNRLFSALEGNNERLITKCKSEFDDLVNKFHTVHAQFVMKKKEDLSDAQHMEVFMKIEESCVAVEDKLDNYLGVVKEKAVEEDKINICYYFQTEATKIIAILKSYQDKEFQADHQVMNRELNFHEQQFYKAVESFESFFALETNQGERAEKRTLQADAEKEVRRLLVEIRTKFAVPSGINGVDTGSHSGRSSAASSGQSGQVLKTKKMDFPKFSGQIRNYLTFKRDFKDLVEQSGEFNAAQMSQVLRLECLKDAPRTLVSNVYDYDELWQRLDDAYLDKQQVVDQVTHELMNTKVAGKGDYEGFIKFVDQVERAHFDLSAMGKTHVMNHPMTTALILERCPGWVKKDAAAKLSQSDPEGEDEFKVVLEILVEKRREARKLQSWYAAEKNRKASQQQKFQKSNNTGKALVVTESVQETSLTSQQVTPAEQSKKPSAGKEFNCITPGCKYKIKHMLAECRAFKRLGGEEKGKLVVGKKLCKLCLSAGHHTDDCSRKQVWKPCDIEQCGRWHSRLLHGATANGVALAVSAVATKGSTMLLVQHIPTTVGKKCSTLWDTGSSVSLVTFSFARDAGLDGVPCHLDLGGVQDRRSALDTKLFGIDLVARDGTAHKIFAFGVEKITSQIPAVDNSSLEEFFPQHKNLQVGRESCDVELLVGIQESALHPVRIATCGKMSLYESRFGTGSILAGTANEGDDWRTLGSARTLLLRGREVGTIDFLSAEAMGVEIPRRCRLCMACKECDFKSHQLTSKENAELAAIESGLTLDTLKKVWRAEYPYLRDPSVLQDNKSQVISCMQALERRLKKNGQMDAFNEQFNDAVRRGVFKKLEEKEMTEYTGPVNYVSIVEAYKAGPHVSTPIRLCMNSSLKFRGLSLNDVLVKGPSSLNNIFSVMLGFRRYPVGMVLDISKFYQSVKSCERDQHLRRVVWRFGEDNKAPDVFVTTCVNFGDRPAGCVAQAALRETARLYRDLSVAASERLIRDSYCDDIVTGGGCMAEVQGLADDMGKIVGLGGFVFKDVVVSGQELSGEQEMKVLGTYWHTKSDALSVDVHINLGEKIRGKRVQEDLVFGNVDTGGVVLTKRLIWRVVLGQFDLLGLICVFTIRLKLVMRMLSTEEGKKIGWDEPVSQQVSALFWDIVREMAELKQLSFPRFIGPSYNIKETIPFYVAFGDGSQLACCALVYVCWPKPEGGNLCRLVAGKTRVAPLRKISVPRLELMGALMATRLLKKVEEVFDFQVSGRFFFTDSAAVLGMIKGESSVMKEFVGTRVGEIQSKTDVAKEWFWVPTDQNVADLGTRDRTRPAEMLPGSVYQNGPAWLALDRREWPVKEVAGTVPTEEVVITASVNVAQNCGNVFNVAKFSSYKRLVRVAMWVCAWRWSVRERKSPAQFFTETNREVVENMLISLAQRDLALVAKLERFSSLRPRIVQTDNCFGGKSELCVVAGRLDGALAIGYDKDYLPLLTAGSSLARLIVKHGHEFSHAGVDRSVQTARNIAWVTQARKIAKSVLASCFECKRRNKTLQGQIMAPLPQHRIPPAPVFSSTAIDLFGPIKVKDFVKRRVSRDAWGVIFVCTFTSAIHLEISEDYSCDSFLLCLRRFMNLRGTPRRIQSDPGTQLVAAAAAVKGWNFADVREWARDNLIEWCVVPANSQHYNGCAEAMIRVTKKQLANLMANRNLTFAELSTLCTEVAHIVNSRPLMKIASGDVLSGGAITPLHLLGGRSTAGVPDVVFKNGSTPTKRLKFLEDLKSEFWRKWFLQVFENLAPSYRWKKKSRNVMAGDVVLVQDSSLFSGKYKLAIVSEVKNGRDGCVRSVKMKYKNVGKNGKMAQFTEIERSVHTVVVVVPVDWKQEAVENAVVEDMAQLAAGSSGGV